MQAITDCGGSDNINIVLDGHMHTSDILITRRNEITRLENIQNSDTES